MKSEPNSYSIEDLKKDKRAFWDGVRNYQARNFMINDMKIGDKVLFYHSNSKPSGVAGLAVVCKKAEPDLTALDKKSIYYDPKSTKDNPRWKAVSVCFEQIFRRTISIKELRQEKTLQKMSLLKKGQRLSILPVTKKEYEYIIKMEKQHAFQSF